MRYTKTLPALAAALALGLAAACDSPSGTPVDGGGPGPVLQSVQVAPDGRTVQAGASLDFSATGRMSDGGEATPEVAWTATGGTITAAGRYTAGQTAGAFRVVATAPNGVADTAGVIVTVPSGTPTLVAVVVTPASASVPAGGTVQFGAAGLLSNGGTTPVAVTWTATGGTIGGTGLYTAGALAGGYRVIATGPGGVADTAAVTVTAAAGGGAYVAVQGDDWKGYRSDADLRGAGFWWFRSEDVMQYVHLAQDPVFGQVVRITFQQSTDIGWAPELDRTFAPLDRMWFRYRVRHVPGWTTVGPLPSGHANAYKQAFWLWDGYQGRGQIEISNTDEYILGFGVNNNGTYLRYNERTLPGSGSFGRVTTEWTDDQWWEFVVYYEKTGATSARQHWWKRRLTTGGAIAPGPWAYVGIEATGATTPRVRGITLGANKNKSNPTTMHLFWGPWEVVDGSRHPNPWGMPNVP